MLPTGNNVSASVLMDKAGGFERVDKKKVGGGRVNGICQELLLSRSAGERSFEIFTADVKQPKRFGRFFPEYIVSHSMNTFREPLKIHYVLVDRKIVADPSWSFCTRKPQVPPME